MGGKCLNDWHEKLNYSLGRQKEIDCDILKNNIANCISVVKTDLELDKSGVDYIATLKNGAQILIDAKTRMKGCSKYWNSKSEPELALEMWSVKEQKKLGWTLKEDTQVDYILYTFPQEDSDKYYFIPFQLLRIAFIRNGRSWLKQYGSKLQKNHYYHSEAIFVPARVVLNAIYSEMQGNIYL